MKTKFIFDEYITSNYTDLSGSKLGVYAGQKYFGYKGDADSGYFIEELAFNILSASGFDFKNFTSNLQVLFSFPDRVFLISLKDLPGIKDDTIVYSLNEFKMEDVESFISELIIDDDNVVFIEYNEEESEFKINHEATEFEQTVSLSNVSATKVVTGFKKFIGLISKIKSDLIAVFLLLTLPAFIFVFINNSVASTADKTIKKLDIQYKLLNAKQIQEKAELEKLNNKYREVEKSKDLIDDEGFVDMIDALKPSSLINEDSIKQSIADAQKNTAVPVSESGQPELPELKPENLQ